MVLLLCICSIEDCNVIVIFLWFIVLMIIEGAIRHGCCDAAVKSIVYIVISTHCIVITILLSSITSQLYLHNK